MFVIYYLTAVPIESFLFTLSCIIERNKKKMYYCTVQTLLGNGNGDNIKIKSEIRY